MKITEIMFAILFFATLNVYMFLFLYAFKGVPEKKFSEENIINSLRRIHIYSVLALATGVIGLIVLYYLGQYEPDERIFKISLYGGIIVGILSTAGNAVLDIQLRKLTKTHYKDCNFPNKLGYFFIIKGALYGVIMGYVIAWILRVKS